MSAFLGDDFLLTSETARRLYHDHAESQPIVDYHTHLSAVDIASDRRFNNLAEIWLEGDHYKWRAMRADGSQLPERCCTGDALPYEKFIAWSRTVPHTLRNPLYHWTHLELQRYFGITELLNVTTAPAIWKRANIALQDGLSVREILRKFRVSTLCTTDDPVDDLNAHLRIRETSTIRTLNGLQRKEGETDVRPTFRPDRALQIDDPASFLPWLDKLRAASNIDICNLATLLDALRQRHDYFGEVGCRASDHGLARCYANPCGEETAAAIFAKALAEKEVSSEEQERYASFLMLFFGRLDSEKRWIKQLHLGARRNLNTPALRKLGPDTGFDAIGDDRQGAALAAYLNLLQSENALPGMVLYNSNPADNHVFAAVAGCFQPSGWIQKQDALPSTLQYGPAWWFLDQKEGIIDQLNALSSVGLLSRFVGMTTDSRSFMSFPRHEYFRRILCDLIGGEVERGELPNDAGLLGGLVQDVCGRNAEWYFGLVRANVMTL
jgi:glucuronate isomerase